MCTIANCPVADAVTCTGEGTVEPSVGSQITTVLATELGGQPLPGSVICSVVFSVSNIPRVCSPATSATVWRPLVKAAQFEFGPVFRKTKNPSDAELMPTKLFLPSPLKFPTATP